MYRILAVNSEAIDCEVMKDILTKKLERSIDFVTATDNENAIKIMKERTVHLLIIEVPHSTAYINNIVWSAYSYHRNIQIILTSVQSEEKLVNLAHKLDVTGYLLKPYRAEDLIKLVKGLEIASQKKKMETGKEERKVYIERIYAGIQEYEYKETIKTAKEYIDVLYDLGDNISLVRPKIIDFLTDILELSQTYSKDTQRSLLEQVDGFRSRYDLQNNRFEVLSVVEKMISIIFEEIERYQIYHDNDIKKVLNYIDRNIRNNISLDDAAAYINKSSSYFSKFFKKQMNVNFITYVTDEKIKSAKAMLRSTNMPIINIAFELSYNETSYFSKAFKRKVGITPTEYRESTMLGN